MVQTGKRRAQGRGREGRPVSLKAVDVPLSLDWLFGAEKRLRPGILVLPFYMVGRLHVYLVAR